TVLGEHEGTYGFTVGQRKGLRVDRPAADGAPRYVLSIEPVARTVTVGPASGLQVREITAQRPVWTGCPPPREPIQCEVQLRAHGEVHPCSARQDGETLQINLRSPASAVAVGQAAVLYSGDTVLGSGTIAVARQASYTSP
uniref:aminomethyltransferase beta-barrel domain-containing protein n=1 Tax=Trebonia sp. TaxID=2767075 RepID=UPI00345B6213